jgi:phosphoglycerate kinase
MAFPDILRFSQLDLKCRRIFLRVDLDVGLTSAGGLLDETGLRRVGSALQALVAARCKVVIVGHARQHAAMTATSTLLASVLSRPVPHLLREFPGEIASMLEGQVALAPNLALFTEEDENDPRWSARVARAFDVYVSEAPAAAREVRASTVGIPALIPARGVGPFLGRDLDMTRDFVDLPASPFTAVVGGSGLARKAEFLRGLLARVDTLALGGVVANTFLVADGWEPRATEYELNALPMARDILQQARARGVQVLLPTDALVFDRDVQPSGAFVNRELDDLAASEAVLDLGSNSRRTYRDVIAQSSTVLWNGLLGDERATPTLEGTADALRAAESVGFAGVVGERSRLRALALGAGSKLRWLATSGDTALELMVGRIPPGVQSLRQPAGQMREWQLDASAP